MRIQVRNILMKTVGLLSMSMASFRAEDRADLCGVQVETGQKALVRCLNVGSNLRPKHYFEVGFVLSMQLGIRLLAVVRRGKYVSFRSGGEKCFG